MEPPSVQASQSQTPCVWWHSSSVLSAAPSAGASCPWLAASGSHMGSGLRVPNGKHQMQLLGCGLPSLVVVSGTLQYFPMRILLPCRAVHSCGGFLSVDVSISSSTASLSLNSGRLICPSHNIEPLVGSYGNMRGPRSMWRKHLFKQGEIQSCQDSPPYAQPTAGKCKGDTEIILIVSVLDCSSPGSKTGNQQLLGHAWAFELLRAVWVLASARK